MKFRTLGLLPVLGAAALGLWLWNGGGGLLPVERQIIWSSAALGQATSAELQIWDEENLLRSVSWRAPLARPLATTLPLRRGQYTVVQIVAGPGERRAVRQALHVGAEPTVELH